MRLKLTIAYDGTGFHGFAAQDGVPTVGGAIAEAIAKVVGQEVELGCAGRTDSGVHARGQVVHCDVESPIDPEALQRSLNRMLGPAIVARNCAIAADRFDARRSALSRRYTYTILNAPVASPFLAATVWHIEEPLDVHALMLSADPLIGEHDFSAFCRRPPDKHPADPISRRVIDARWMEMGGPEDGRILVFEITATAFCHQMVRSLVGTMVEMGRGKRRAGEMAAVLRARDRANAGAPAPPQGLCLVEVVYPEGM